jgi:hypothetical protein
MDELAIRIAGVEPNTIESGLPQDTKNSIGMHRHYFILYRMAGQSTPYIVPQLIAHHYFYHSNPSGEKGKRTKSGGLSSRMPKIGSH